MEDRCKESFWSEMIQETSLEERIDQVSRIPKPYTYRRRWWIYYDIIFEDTTVVFSVSDRSDAERIVGALNGAYMLGWLESRIQGE